LNVGPDRSAIETMEERSVTTRHKVKVAPEIGSSQENFDNHPSEKPTKSHEAIVSDRRGQKYLKMCAIHENALMRSAIDHDIGSIFPMSIRDPSQPQRVPQMSTDRLSKIPVDSTGQPLLAMVRIAANKEKVIPKDYEHLIPSDEITISSLLKTSLPTVASAANLLRPAKSCVACEPPSWTEDQLKTMQVPSKEWLMALDGAIVEAWLGGARSIEHPSDPSIRFPLWVGTFWTALSEVIQQQKEWRRAQEWVLTLTHGQETRKIQAVFKKIPRKTYIWILPVEADRAVTKISFFAQLLSDGFLAERHLDAFVAYLNIQVCRSRLSAPGVLVADLPFSYTLSLHHNATAGKILGCTLLLQYTAVFKFNAAYHTLLFPAHVSGVEDGHWVVFSVNFAERSYCFGESYGECVGSMVADLIPLSA
jgi:hypothetical protein